jgi:hypothetical protein
MEIELYDVSDIGIFGNAIKLDFRKENSCLERIIHEEQR